MLPLVVNSNPARLVQVTMTGPVGTGGTGAKDDTVLVQSLLNAIPSGEGGPQTRLKVDGIVGPVTVAAIRRYQQACAYPVDGRVDVLGPTIKSLVTTLNNRNALPAGLPNIGPPSEGVVRALAGRGLAPSVMSRADRDNAGAVGQVHKAKSLSGFSASPAPPFSPHHS